MNPGVAIAIYSATAVGIFVTLLVFALSLCKAAKRGDAQGTEHPE